MAKTSTLTVKLDGTPLVGAEVFSSAGTTVAITDGDGKISAPYADDYAKCIIFAIRHSSIPNLTCISTCILEAGEDYVANIPATIGAGGGTGHYGSPRHFMRNI